MTAFHLQQDPIPNDKVSPCIGGQHQATVGLFLGGQGAKAGGIAYDEHVSPTLRAAPSGSNQVPDMVTYAIGAYASNAWKSPNPHSGVYVTEVAKTLDLNGGNPSCNQGGVCVVALDCRNLVGNPEISGTLQAKSNGGQSLNYQNPVVYDARGNGAGGVPPTMTGDHQNRVTDYTAIAVYDTTQITNPKNQSNPQIGAPCHPLAARQHPPLKVEEVHPTVTGALCANSHPGSYTGQDAFNDMLPVTPSDESSRRYIVRRLTPLECCRLQGFPDWWEDGVEGSDSARYKMWGNGIALPCAVDVLGRIATEVLLGE